MQSAGDRSHTAALVGSEGSWPMRQVAEEQSAWDGAAVFVAMELSKSAWLLAVQGSPSGKTSSHRLAGGDVAGLLALLRRLQAREQQARGDGEVQVILGYEAGKMVCSQRTSSA